MIGIRASFSQCPERILDPRNPGQCVPAIPSPGESHSQSGATASSWLSPAQSEPRSWCEQARIKRRSLFSSRTDGGFTVPAQVPTPSARGRSERGWHRGHQPAWPRPDVHFPGDSVHRCHRLPEHRCKEAQGWARARGTPLSPGLPSPCAD